MKNLNIEDMMKVRLEMNVDILNRLTGDGDTSLGTPLVALLNLQEVSPSAMMTQPFHGKKMARLTTVFFLYNGRVNNIQ